MRGFTLIPAVATLATAMTITVKQITPETVADYNPYVYPFFWPYYPPMPFLDPVAFQANMQDAFAANWKNMATSMYVNQMRMGDMLNPSGTRYRF